MGGGSDVVVVIGLSACLNRGDFDVREERDFDLRLGDFDFDRFLRDGAAAFNGVCNCICND